MKYTIHLLLTAAPAALVFASCGGSVEAPGGSGGTSSSSSSSASSSSSSSASSSGAASSSSSSSSSAASSSSSSSSSSSASSSTGSPAGCTPSCNTDADCVATCAPPPFGTSCCNPQSHTCSYEPVCPCLPGGSCTPGTPACKAPVSSCADLCTCGSTGTWSCTDKTAKPVCPATHPTCGAPCNPSVLLDCVCDHSPEPGEGPCGCDPTTSTWTCWPSVGTQCPPVGSIQKGSTCTDYPAGLTCDFGSCTCVATCGTQVWDCGSGP